MPEPLADLFERARRLSLEPKPAEFAELRRRIEAEHAAVLTAGDRVLLGILGSVSLLNSESPTAGEPLDGVRDLLPRVGILRRARFLATEAAVASLVGQEGPALDRITEALFLIDSVPLEPSRELSAVLGNAGQYLGRLELYDRGSPVLDRALRVASEAGIPDPALRFQAGTLYACWAMRSEHLGDAAGAAERWRRADEHLAAATRPGNDLPTSAEIAATCRRALSLARLGDGPAARAELDRADRLAEGADVPDVAFVRHGRLKGEAVTLAAMGDLEGAARTLAAYQLDAGDSLVAPWDDDLLWSLAGVARRRGRDAEALDWLQQLYQRYASRQADAWVSHAVAAELRVRQRVAEHRAERAELAALRDPLTGLANRRVLAVELPRRVAEAHRDGRPLCVAVLDIDAFKTVNDVHGHLVGDEVLRRLGRILAGTVGEGDLCVRFGGDEFVLCLAADAAAAGRLLLRVELAVAAEPWHDVAAGLRISAATGVAQLGPDDSADSVFRAADLQALAGKRLAPGRPSRTRSGTA